MKYDLKDEIVSAIISIAEKYPISKIVIFGSRAKGDNKPASDIDLAVYTLPDFAHAGHFTSDIEDMQTLLKIDIVFIDKCKNDKLIANIENEGVTIYERL
jgi:predicted nucleotidyltransferase